MKKDTIQKLTKAEEQIMHIVWNLGKGFLKDILDEIPEPKPHSNTVATILKILVEKQFLEIEVYGRNHMYIPIVTKEEYSKFSVNQLVNGFFKGNVADMVSFMVKEKDLSLSDLEMLLKELKNKQ